MYMATKKYSRKKDKKLSLRVQIVIESHSFLEYWQYRTDYCGPYQLLYRLPAINLK